MATETELDKLKKQREEVAAKRAEVAKKRAAREAIEAEAHALADEQLSLDEERLVEEVGSTLGRRGVDWELVATTRGAFILTVPHRVVWSRLQELKEMTTVAINEMVVHCLKGIDPKRYYEFVDLAPGLTMRCGEICKSLAEGKRESDRGK